MLRTVSNCDNIICAHYEERLRRRRRDPSTIRSFLQAARVFSEWLNQTGMDPRTVQSWALEDFLNGLRYSPGTKKLYKDHIGAAYRYAHARGTILQNPFVDVELERVPDREPAVIPPSELRDIRSRALSERQWLVFHLATYTGMRHSEIRELDWEHVDLPNNTIRVLGKGGKLRYVPIHPALGEVLEPTSGAILGNPYKRPISSSTLYKTLRSMAPDRSFHDFRRTVATSLARNDVPERVIDKILGWAPRTVRNRYYVNVAGRELQDGILCLYRDEPI